MYSLQLIPVNEDANKTMFNNWMIANQTFQGIAYLNDGTAEIYFASEPSAQTQTDINDYYQALTSSDVDHVYETKQLYIPREEDGLNYYEEWRAGLIVDYDALTLTEENINYIENKLFVVTSKILTGDWLTAHYEIHNNVLTNETVTQADIDEGYTQARHDAVSTYIDDYIDTNYNVS